MQSQFEIGRGALVRLHFKLESVLRYQRSALQISDLFPAVEVWPESLLEKDRRVSPHWQDAELKGSIAEATHKAPQTDGPGLAVIEVVFE